MKDKLRQRYALALTGQVSAIIEHLSDSICRTLLMP
jgi:hypothetical protein